MKNKRIDSWEDLEEWGFNSKPGSYRGLFDGLSGFVLTLVLLPIILPFALVRWLAKKLPLLIIAVLIVVFVGFGCGEIQTGSFSSSAHAAELQTIDEGLVEWAIPYIRLYGLRFDYYQRTISDYEQAFFAWYESDKVFILIRYPSKGYPDWTLFAEGSYEDYVYGGGGKASLKRTMDRGERVNAQD